MSAPDPLQAVAALHRCMAAKDYAGAARLVTRQATLDGLNALAQSAYQAAAEAAYRESVAAWRAEHAASLRRRLERDVAAMVAIVAEAVQGAGKAEVRPEQAARNRDLLTEALRPGRAA